jgi:hypothetical protein
MTVPQAYRGLKQFFQCCSHAKYFFIKNRPCALGEFLKTSAQENGRGVIKKSNTVKGN